MNVVSIVIPIYNRIKITKIGLDALNKALSYYHNNGKNAYDFKIIVVDDGSTDNGPEFIEDNYPAVIVLRTKGDLWWSGAINVGCHYAIEELKTNYLLLWNDDTTCAESYFYELEKFLTDNAAYSNSIIVSKVYWQHKSNFLFNFGSYFNAKNGRKTHIGLNEEDTYNQVIPVDWAGGMGALIPAAIVTSVNYFDDKLFPQYYGDIDFFLRAKKMGFRAVAVPTLKIYNNLESTGIENASSIKELKTVLFSNRSIINIKQCYWFNLRHSNTIITWIRFCGKYTFLLLKTFKNIIFKKMSLS